MRGGATFLLCGVKTGWCDGGRFCSCIAVLPALFQFLLRSMMLTFLGQLWTRTPIDLASVTFANQCGGLEHLCHFPITRLFCSNLPITRESGAGHFLSSTKTFVPSSNCPRDCSFVTLKGETLSEHSTNVSPPCVSPASHFCRFVTILFHIDDSTFNWLVRLTLWKSHLCFNVSACSTKLMF